MSGDRRQLTAVMLTDIVGFSALAHRDESRALAMADQYDALVRTLVESNRGRTIKSLGDGVLAVFDSALEAVACAVATQDAVARRNDGADEPVVLRIGVHLGDVTHRDDDVFGDAVNIAARVESFADPGGVVVTRQVLDQVHRTSGRTFRSLGKPSLKNIETAIELFAVEDLSSTVPASQRSGRGPRLVVLPLVTISPGGGDDYFADGLTEEIIERLAHVEGLRVIARTTSMHFKDSRETALAIGRSLNVDAVLESSVRTSGDRLRITSQLIDTKSEEHLWADRYDRGLDDVFAVQDDVAGRIVTAIAATLVTNEGAVTRAPRESGASVDPAAYGDFVRARALWRQKTSEATIRDALALFERAVAREPGFARARVGAVDCALWLAGEGQLPLEATTVRAYEDLTRALADDESLGEAHSALAALLLGDDDIVGARREAQRALELNPGDPEPYRWLAQVVAGGGHIDEALSLLEEAHQLDPLNVNVIAFLGRAYFYSGRLSRALEFWDETASQIEFRTNQHRTEYYLSIGDLAASRAGLAEMRRLRPTSVWVTTFGAILAAREGDEEAAREAVSVLDEMERTGVAAAFFRGFVRYALGEFDGFWADMELAFADHNLPLLELRYSPLFDEARRDPRYDDLIDRQMHAEPRRY